MRIQLNVKIAINKPVFDSIMINSIIQLRLIQDSLKLKDSKLDKNNCKANISWVSLKINEVLKMSFQKMDTEWVCVQSFM